VKGKEGHTDTSPDARESTAFSKPKGKHPGSGRQDPDRKAKTKSSKECGNPEDPMPTHHLKDKNYGSSLVTPYRRSLGKRLTCAATRVSREQPRILRKVTSLQRCRTSREETKPWEQRWNDDSTRIRIPEISPSRTHYFCL